MAARKLDLDLGLEQLETHGQVLDGDERRPLLHSTRLDVNRHPAVRQLEGALDAEAVAAPLEHAAAATRRSNLPRIDRRAPVETVVGAPDLAGGTGIRERDLPAAAVASRPGRLVEVAAERLLGPEGRPAEELAPRAQIDEVEHLAAVARVEADEQLGRAQDDHGDGWRRKCSTVARTASATGVTATGPIASSSPPTCISGGTGSGTSSKVIVPDDSGTAASMAATISRRWTPRAGHVPHCRSLETRAAHGRERAGHVLGVVERQASSERRCGIRRPERPLWSRAWARP